jgi:hypothetical protein
MFHNDVENEIYAKMVTWTEGADDSAPDYYQKALEPLEEIKKTIRESKHKLLEKLLPLYNPALGQQWWGALRKMDICYSGKLNIEKLGQIAGSSVDGDEIARCIEIWLKPDLERQRLGFPPEKDLQGTKSLEFFLAKKNYIYIF